MADETRPSNLNPTGGTSQDVAATAEVPGVTGVGSTLLLARLTLLGAVSGLCVGLWEAGEIFFVPSVRVFLSVDATYVAWFLVPLLDLVLYGLGGAILGCLAVLLARAWRPWMSAVAVSLLVGAMGAHIGWSLHFLHYTLPADFNAFANLRSFYFPCIRFVAVFALALLLALRWRNAVSKLVTAHTRWPYRSAAALASLTVLLLAGLVFYAVRQWRAQSAFQADSGNASSEPNIILITLDTVRADHLSLYGYSRMTTPNLDRLARRGVVFENAISPVPWTLPSLGSMFTGLVPHQHGANASRPLNLAYTTIAEALRDRGYKTAAFNANHFYGQAGWGIGQGFNTYEDPTDSVGYNLSRTLLSRVVIQPVYQTLKRHDVFYRRPAGEVDQEVFRWLGQGHNSPFFLYVNYFDAHSPYLAPSPYDHRFGEVSPAIIRAGAFGSSSQSLSDKQRGALINAYDNCLAYLDAQVGRLIQFIDESPYGKNTVVILTADHGEAFGEHGVYRHGDDLHQEQIHVPLVVWGPRIPAGERVVRPVPVQELFATAIDLAVGNKIPLYPFSLCRFWGPAGAPASDDDAMLSELSSARGRADGSSVSLTTADWQYIFHSRGKEELYRWPTDPHEKNNLSTDPASQRDLALLRVRLRAIIRTSLRPWLGREYLAWPATVVPSIAGTAPLSSDFRATRPPLGSAQAYLERIENAVIPEPADQDRDLLNSLPYQ